MPGGREDRLALELVQLDQAGRRKLGTARGIGFGECEREDPTGRSPGNEIEQLAGRTTGLSLQLGEDHRGDDAADAAAIDAQDANWLRHVSPHGPTGAVRALASGCARAARPAWTARRAGAAPCTPGPSGRPSTRAATPWSSPSGAGTCPP